MRVKNNIEDLKEVLADFFMSEYGYNQEEANEELQDLDCHKETQIAFTTLGDDEELSIEVFINVEDCRLEQVVSGINIQKVELTEYDSMEHMISDISYCEFENLTRLDDFDVDDLILEDKNKVQTS